MNYNKMVEKICRKQFISPLSKQEHCQYIGHGKKYCKATTQISCVGCRFFNPRFHSKLIALCLEIKSLEKKIKEQENKIYNLK